MSKATRRDVLKMGFAAGASGLLGSRAEVSLAATPVAAATPQVGAGETLDVAIIGAGVSGLYSAWRLLSPDAGNSAALQPLLAQAGGRPLDVAVFEESEHTGGRMFSVTPPGMPHLRAELGGMRFLTTHTFVARLVDELGLAVDNMPVNEPTNRVYLRGQHFQVQDFANPAKVPYHLPPQYAGLAPDAMMLAAIKQFIPNADTMTAREWDRLKQTAVVDGLALTDAGFWNLMLETIGIEGYHFLHDAIGYGGFITNWNAVEAMEYLVSDFLGNPQYRKLRDGFQAIPTAIAQRVTATGGRIFHHHQLRRIDRVTENGEVSLALNFVVWPDGRPLSIRARHVILAMPRRSIVLLDPDTFLFTNDQFLADLDTVTAKPASKIFLGYERPWWEDIGLRAGRSLTDLPLRQCYYWGVEGDQPGADPANRHALLMPSYNDAAEVEYWNEELTQPFRPRPMPIAAPPRPMDGGASDNLVTEAQRQLAELHGPDFKVPDPYVAYFQDWVRDPYGGGYHFWQVGAKSWEVMPRMRHPISDANVYICGEAWSTGQGWVLGALNTAERMLEDQFGFSRPSWLPADVYLGE